MSNAPVKIGERVEARSVGGTTEGKIELQKCI